MDATWKSALWSQFGAAIDSLDAAIVACPDDLWSDRSRRPEFWYVAFHTLFWLDAYLSPSLDGFAPPAPYDLTEMDPEGRMPARVYTKDEMREYVAHGRRKCRAAIAALSDEGAREPRRLGSKAMGTALELHLYNLRHVQHHAAQLNLVLRQATDSAPRWIAKPQDELEGG